MKFKKEDLRTFINDKIAKKIDEVEKIKSDKMTSLVIPVLDTVIKTDGNIIQTSSRIIAVIDGVEKIRNDHPVVKNEYRVSSELYNTLFYASSISKLNNYIREEYINIIKKRTNIDGDRDCFLQYNRYNKIKFLEDYKFNYTALEEATLQLIEFCKEQDKIIEQLNILKKELLRIINNSSSPNKAYNDLIKLNVDMNGFIPSTITALAPLSLSVDVNLLNGYKEVVVGE